MNPCAKCGENPYCRKCRNTYQNEYRRRRYRDEPSYRHAVKISQQVRRYGLTEAQYTELWAQQGGVCAICRLETETRPLSVDHCHGTGRIRGLLCDSCNGAIGMLRESPAIALSAIAYLETHAHV